MSDRYETRDWVVGDHAYKVRVQRHPGKFEGEPVWVELFYAASSWADGSIYRLAGDSEWVADCFRAPFGLDAFGEDELDAMGNPPELTEDELACLRQYAGAILSEDSQGFVYCELYESTADYERAIDELERDS